MDARGTEARARSRHPRSRRARRRDPTRIAVAAVLIGTGWAMILQSIADRPISAITAVAALTVLGSIGLLARRARHGPTDLVFLHHLLVAVAATAAVAIHPAVPALATLDVTVTGMFVIMGIGRLGCHTGCCCHGRPVRHGVVYDAGRLTLPAQGLAGVPLAPVQLAESAVGLSVAALATIITIGHPVPGVAAAMGVSLYGLARPLLEAWRGDGRRLRRGALSGEVVLPVALALFATAGLALLIAEPSGVRLTTMALGVTGAAAALAGFVHLRGHRLTADDLLRIAAAARALDHDAIIGLSCGAELALERSAGGEWRAACARLHRRDAALALRTARAVATASRRHERTDHLNREVGHEASIP